MKYSIFTHRRVIIAAFVAVFLVAGVMFSQATEAPFTIDIFATPTAVKTGDDVVIGIVLKNVSGRPLKYIRNSPDCDFDVTVLDANGMKPPDTEHGRMVHQTPCSAQSISHFDGSLKPNGYNVDHIAVDGLYDMRGPGNYTIQVQKQLSSDIVKSNIITVTVTE